MSIPTYAHEPKIALSMDELVVSRFFPEPMMRLLGEIAPFAGLIPDISDPRVRRDLREVEVLVTGWGCQPLNSEVLADLPSLRAVVHSGGSVRAIVTPEAWARGLQVSSQVRRNAVPVAQFTLAAIVFAGKRVWQLARSNRATAGHLDPSGLFPRMGNTGICVGIVGASHVGRLVIDGLRAMDVEILLYDPYVDASELGVRGVDLPTLVRSSDVVSIHAPSVPETFHMFDAALLGLMRPGATLINTARGALVDHDALATAISQRDLFAVLDVTDPEPLPPNSPLWQSDSVVITPHIAGSQGLELRELGAAAVREVSRYFAGEPFADPVRADALAPQA